jgi:hypothetical protein
MLGKSDIYNPHKNGSFDALMQNGQKYAVFLQCLLTADSEFFARVFCTKECHFFIN